MNIEKLAKHLKEFTLDEMEMIAECDCKTEIERLLSSNKILFCMLNYNNMTILSPDICLYISDGFKTFYELDTSIKIKEISIWR